MRVCISCSGQLNTVNYYPHEFVVVIQKFLQVLTAKGNGKKKKKLVEFIQVWNYKLHSSKVIESDSKDIYKFIKDFYFK